MGIGSAIMGFLTALPDIVKLVQSGMTWLNHVSGNDPQGLVKKIGAAMTQLNNAQTVAERQAAAKAIADSLRGL